MVEIHGLGIRRIEFEPVAVVGLVVDLAAADATRTPGESADSITIDGITLPRLGVAAETAPLPLILAALRIPPAGH
jgi:hypothetical protein